MKIIKPLSNLHTHTNFSDGRDTAEEQIDAAIACGFVSIGISDHSHNSFDCYSMKAGCEEEYASHIRKLAEQYKDKIDVFAGLELDSFSVCNRDLFDYIIGSVHFIDAGEKEYIPIDLSAETQKDAIKRYFGGDEIGFVRAYYDELVRHIKACKPDIVGHFDLLTKFESIDESSSEYRRIALEAVREIMKTCMRFEINTGAIARGYKSTVYPSQFVLEEIKRLGGSVTVSSDAHKTEGLDVAFDKALKAATEAGFTHIDRFTRDGFVQDEIDI